MGKKKPQEKVVIAETKANIGRVKRKKQKPATILASPFELSWPMIEEDDQEFIRKRLNCTLSELPIARWKGPLPSCEGPFTDLKSKNERKKVLCKEHWEKGNEFRRHFAFGISKVIRELENDKLAVVLVSRDVKPVILVEPLLTLCSSKSVPAGAVNKVAPTIKTCLNFNSCSAFGIKKSVLSLDSEDVIYKLYEDIKDKLPDLPQLLDLIEEPQLQPEPSQQQKLPKPPINKDYSCLYILKTNIKPVKPTEDFLSLDSTSKCFSNFIPLTSQTSSLTTGKKRRFKEMKLKKINPKKMKP